MKLCDKAANAAACVELRQTLGSEDIVAVLQCNRLRWYGHVLWKDDSEWVQKCMDYVTAQR